MEIMLENDIINKLEYIAKEENISSEELVINIISNFIEGDTNENNYL